jgi:hypothetical protein
VKGRVPGGKTPVKQTLGARTDSYGRSMRTNDDILLQDAWGADRLAWEDEEEEAQSDQDEKQAPEDPRY